jgi:hypothetical protein
MSDPMIAIAGVSAVLSLWALITGRGLGAWPGWVLKGRAFRLAAAYTFVISVLAIALALTHHDGIAFVTYAVLTLVLVVAIQVIGNRRQAT